MEKKEKSQGRQAVNLTSCREEGVGERREERRERLPFEPSQHGGQPYGKQADTWQEGEHRRKSENTSSTRASVLSSRKKTTKGKGRSVS